MIHMWMGPSSAEHKNTRNKWPLFSSMSPPYVAYYYCLFHFIPLASQRSTTFSWQRRMAIDKCLQWKQFNSSCWYLQDIGLRYCIALLDEGGRQIDHQGNSPYIAGMDLGNDVNHLSHCCDKISIRKSGLTLGHGTIHNSKEDGSLKYAVFCICSQ